MGRKRLVVIFLLLIALSSCSLFFRNYYRNGAGGVRPKQSKYQLAKPAPYLLKPGDAIDTGAVYIARYTLQYEAATEDKYSFLRFFSDGRYFQNFTSDESRLELPFYNNIQQAYITGYYRLENTTQLQLEDFSVIFDRPGKYSRSTGMIRGDSIFVFPGTYPVDALPAPVFKNNECANCHIYIRKKTAGLTGQPDW